MQSKLPLLRIVQVTDHRYRDSPTWTSADEKEWRNQQLGKECPFMLSYMQPILKGFLLTSQNGKLSGPTS